MAEILVIDDEAPIRETLKEILEYENFNVTLAEDGQKGYQYIQKNDYDVVLCDVKMPGMDGMEVLERSLALKPELPFVMISGHGNVEMAIDATKKGAFDFITKPPDLNRLLITLRNAIERTDLVTETKVLKRKVSKTFDIIGETPAISKIKETIEKVAPTEARVLITGENGTGKELVARWLHEKSARSEMPLIEVNCASIPTELIESELFGHEKGAFTSAIKQRIGKFEQAHGGTLFLDEIGDMSMAAQAKVLRAIQEGKITRVGGDKEIKVDVRIVAATNKNLLEEIEKGQFRMDLYHRLSVILMHVPTLNERKEDIVLIAEHFLEDICAENGLALKTFTPDGYDALKEVNWTGNIRELRNVVERLVILCGDAISGEDVYMYSNPAQRGADPFGVVDEYQTLQDFRDWAEKVFIERKLIQNGWNVAKTASEIDIQRSHLYNKIDKYNLKRR
ncbi:MAG: sigma-54 dependent transcriptional regulator [Bacteroidetes bacterium]|nr:sigma-54 dependent transcriptional regulator [Bacteroidota bacterium]MDA0943905.1 sigma-54 dependent transcriptional regulator [Bacteroidota bacterium]MDA1112086.1 sigma-54 dependent transcriptional regulator [Bacteroidota bacterium]